MYNPVSTYRIQFNKEFTFDDFLKNVKYFAALGISSVYASPVFEASPGSMHGYDVTNPLLINPEIGTKYQFEKISEILKEYNIGWIQDIVPNHMAFHNRNKWLMDVLEKGRNSKYAGFFDIDFSHPGFQDKIMVPFLGKTPEEALKGGEIKAGLVNDKLVFRYYDSWFPFSFESVREILIMNPSAVTENLTKHVTQHKTPNFPEIFRDLYSRVAEFRAIMDERIDIINSDPELIKHFLDLQNYTLCYWKDSLNILNYRRFFTVNSLICLSMEKDEVFEEYHTYIKELLEKKAFNGLRIDHIDGLQKPAKYLDQLRLLAGEETYIVTEKILGLKEELPVHLPVQGTSGYDFLGIVNNLFTRKSNYGVLQDFYKTITGIKDDPEDLIYDRKKFILTSNMNGEWENLVRQFDESGFITYDPEISRESVKEAIGEFLVLFPVYKIYDDTFPLSSEDADIVRLVFRKAKKKNQSLEKSLEAIENVFLTNDGYDEEKIEKALSFFLRCLQFTGPLMAKGVEDTVMYYYNCFICHNEVGDHTSSPGISAERFHELMISRRRNWPMSMNGTSTHDTKRGEDVRARLNVISELPEIWIRHVHEWMKGNSRFRLNVNGKAAPDTNEEYFIYQTLTGAFPFDGKADEAFLSRMDKYIEKALREAKSNSDWNEVNTPHESAVKNFTRSILKRNSRFMKSFLPFQKRIAAFGVINSLSQLLLKMTCPGIPDFYQGTELWDLSLVDPDNRQPVDYSLRQKLLNELQASHDDDNFSVMVKNRSDGRLKFRITHVLLEERKANPDMFLHGSYIPLKTEGKLKDHVLAFARRHNSSWIITVIPLFIASMDKSGKEPGKINWENTSIRLPDLAPLKWSALFTGQNYSFRKRIKLSGLMRFPLPVILKSSLEAPSRFAGVLAHISSLPGRYGTGDLGYEAFAFADILSRNGQRYWQILPFNPTGKGYGWSPYSSISAFAGNTLFISPDLLSRMGLLKGDRLKVKAFSKSSIADFERASDLRSSVSDEVFTNFFCRERPYQHEDFNRFCRQQEFWLDDFAMFSILKREHNNIPWNEWPAKYRNRTKTGITELKSRFESDLKKEKFMQYIFNRQWLELKQYCNSLGIKLIGDMSFYVNYDSAEVWAHPVYFKLDGEKKPLTVAGVPPDYFSETGQLWNMPVYNWAWMKKDRYSWWINRIKRNLELCDLLRFDHFRAFSEYWEIPFGEVTAINGKWTAGPGSDFFEQVKKEYPGMPFIAEDLGSIDDKVYKLRDDYGLPGMVVLQFAFGENTARSAYIPHNFIPGCVVYTGTHDNNTTKGWYKNELDEMHRKEASAYLGYKIHQATCHKDFIRMAYSSVARIAIIPVQDLLGLGESGRLNKPSTSENNWTWKMKTEDMQKIFTPEVRRMVRLYGRI